MPEELRLHCNSCGGVRRHESLREYEVADPEERTALISRIVRCAGCETIAFSQEKRGLLVEEWEVLSSEVYPPREYRPVKQFAGVPAHLEQLYRESLAAMNSSSFLLCAGGLRALVEGICSERGVTDGPRRDGGTGMPLLDKAGVPRRGSALDCKIEGLQENGFVTRTQADALHEHRYLGNEALHELAIPQEEHISDAVTLIEQIMDALYDLPFRAGNLRARRGG